MLIGSLASKEENHDPIDDAIIAKAKQSEEFADKIIKLVGEHIGYIRYAEEFNGRIGSKALFK